MVRYLIIAFATLVGCDNAALAPAPAAAPATTPQQPAVERTTVEPEEEPSLISGSRLEELTLQMWAGTLSLEEMGAYWKEHFTYAVEYGHTAVASKAPETGWMLRLDVPTQLQQTATLVMVAALSTSDAIELVSKEVWTIPQGICGIGLTVEDIHEDRRIECLLEELPTDRQVVLTLAVRPWSNPEAEPEVVCRHTFPITIEP